MADNNTPDIRLHIGADVTTSRNTIEHDLQRAFNQNPLRIDFGVKESSLNRIRTTIQQDLAAHQIKLPLQVSKSGVDFAALQKEFNAFSSRIAKLDMDTAPFEKQLRSLGAKQRKLFTLDPDSDEYSRTLQSYLRMAQKLSHELDVASRRLNSSNTFVDQNNFTERVELVESYRRQIDAMEGDTTELSTLLERVEGNLTRVREALTTKAARTIFREAADDFAQLERRMRDLQQPPPPPPDDGGNDGGGGDDDGGDGFEGIGQNRAFRTMQLDVQEARRQLNLMDGDTRQLASTLDYVEDMMDAALGAQNYEDASRYWDDARVALHEYRTEMSTFQTGGANLKKSLDLGRQLGDSTRRFNDLERAFNSLQNPADELRQAFDALRVAQLELEQFSPDMDNAWVQQQLREVQRLRAEYERLLRSYGTGSPTTRNSFDGSKQQLNRIDVVTGMVETLQSLRHGSDAAETFDNEIQQLLEHLIALRQANSIEAINEELRRGDEIIQNISRHIQETQNHRKLLNVQSDIQAEADKFEVYLHELKPKAFSVLGDDIEAIRNLFRDIPDDLGAAQALFDEITSKTKKFRAECKKTGYESGNAIEFMTRKMKEYGTYLVSSMLTDGLYRAFSKVIENVKTLDDALVNIRMVTGDNVAAARELLLVYNDIAKELGASTVDVSESAVEWLRQGYSEQDTNNLIRDSMVLSKVGFMDNAEAAQALTAAMKGYGVAAADAMTIVDKFTKVDQLAATSAGNLATALSKTAANAKVAGLELDEVIGYLAVVNETLQEDAESTGGKMRLVA